MAAPFDAGTSVTDGGCGNGCGFGLSCVDNRCGPIVCDGGCSNGLSCLDGFCTDQSCTPSCPTTQVCLQQVCIVVAQSDGPPSCAAPRTLCDGGDGYCADLASDPANCGACGSACPPGDSCTSGACLLPSVCPPGLSLCDAGCIQLDDDPDNCGACSNACTLDETCRGGRCEPVSCPAGQTACDGGCTDVGIDPANCGGCGNPCPLGIACLGGACTSQCAVGQIICGGSCVDTETDPNNCNGCGNVCPSGQACNAGSCGCPTGQTQCDGGCPALVDVDNCGACGLACSSNQVCQQATSGGIASCYTCAPNLVACANTAQCAELSTDVVSCGACGNICAGGDICSDGGCVTPGLTSLYAQTGVDCLPYGMGAATGADGRIYLVGGENDCSGYTSQVMAFASNLFSAEANVPFPCFSVTAGAGKQLYAFGRSSSADEAGLAYDTAANQWTKLTTCGPAVDYGAAAAASDGNVYQLGGMDPTQGVVASVYALNPDAGTCTLAAGMLSAAEGLGAVTGPDGRIYAVGGWNGTLAIGENGSAVTFEAFTPGPDGGSWSTPSQQLPTPRGFLGAAIGADGRLYAIGGTADEITALDTVEIYDFDAGTWSTGPQMPTPRWHLSVAASPDGRIYAFGGQNANDPSNVLPNVEALDVATQTWIR